MTSHRSPPNRPTRRQVCRLALGCGLAGAGLSARAAPDDSRFDTNFQPAPWRDQDGAAFDWSSLRGHMCLFNFVYTGCSTVCPVQTQVLVQMRRDLTPLARGGLRQVSVSVDPLGDTPATLKAFASRHGVDLPSWRFLSGTVAQVEQLGRRLRLFGGDGSASPALHNTAVWLVGSDGRLMQRYTADPPDPARLVRDIQALQAMRVGATGRDWGRRLA